LHWLISELVTLAALAYVFLQLIMVVRYRGRWLALSLAPLGLMLPLAVHAGLAFAAGSGLWAVPLILAAPFGFLYLLGLAIAKAIVT
jgi:hypothetical protein